MNIYKDRHSKLRVLEYAITNRKERVKLMINTNYSYNLVKFIYINLL